MGSSPFCLPLLLQLSLCFSPSERFMTKTCGSSCHPMHVPSVFPPHLFPPAPHKPMIFFFFFWSVAKFLMSVVLNVGSKDTHLKSVEIRTPDFREMWFLNWLTVVKFIMDQLSKLLYLLLSYIQLEILACLTGQLNLLGLIQTSTKQQVAYK